MNVNRLERDVSHANLGALVDDAAARYGEAPLWESIDDGSTLSFAAFAEQTVRCAHGLRALGVEPGSHVAVMLPNVSAYVITWIALARLGAVMVPVNTRSTSRELEYVLRDSDSRFLVIDAAYREALDGIENRDSVIAPTRVVVHREGGPWSAMVAAASSDAGGLPAPTPETLMSIQYTSGSTGFPKGCMLTQDYWIVLGYVRAHQGPRPSRLLIDKPLTYMGGKWRFLMCLYLGCTACVAQRFSLSGLQQRLVDHRIDFFAATDAVAKLPEHPGVADLDIAWISIAGLSKALHAPLEKKFGAPVRELYGLTETGSTLYMPTDATHMVGSGSCGLPAPYRQCRIVDPESGSDVAVGETGELWVSGRGILKGYYNKPDATREAFSGEWFRTGDLFRQDAEGYYYIQGRIKDSIRRSGENISAREVESVAAGIPGVLEAAAVAAPDELRGQEVKLCLVLQPGAEVTPEQVIAHCSERLAAFKVPRYVEYYDEFPRTSSNKIAKQALSAAARPGRVYDRTTAKWL
ncbi:MAG TPA: class I adenylate-forming enzyme family protein [Burkholderiales bacterium]|nr:class I adenylate-forming enzyme family protein [Burkholderiales bacterium]